MATGALDANGIWQYGEDDSETTFSALLNKLGGSTSTTVTRLEEMGGITAAQAETARANLRVGLVPLSPTAVTIATGTGSANALGVVTFTGASAVSLENIFSSTYDNYRYVLKITGSSLAGNAVRFRYRVGGVDAAGTNYNQGGAGSNQAGTVMTINRQAAADFYILYLRGDASNMWSALSGDIFNPNKASYTSMVQSFQWNDGTNLAAGSSGGIHQLANAYDGFSLITTGGTITGTVQVFGYND